MEYILNKSIINSVFAIMLDDIQLFVIIVREGGLAGAAKALSIPAATVTRRLQRLEQQLQCKLLNRNARQCELTHEGEVYYQAYSGAVEQFELANEQLQEQKQPLSGKLKVLAPFNLSHGMLRPFLVRFTRDYPEIQLELQLNNSLEDLVKAQADLAIRIGPQSSSSLTQQRLAVSSTLITASGEYLHKYGAPDHPSELKAHSIVGTTMRHKWLLKEEEGKTKYEFYPRYKATFSDTSFVKYLALDGQGLCLLAGFEIYQEVQQGNLVPVLENWRGEPRPIYVLWPSGRLISEKAKLFKRELSQYLSAHLNERLV